MKALMYHYVRYFEPEMSGLNFLHVDDFSKQLDFLDQEYGFVKKDQFIDAIKNKKKCPEGVILTFDDGLKDHYKNVLPLLLKKNLWGIFYISSGMYEEEKLLSVQKTQFLLAKYNAKEILEEIKSVKDNFKSLDSSLLDIHNNKLYLHQDTSFEELAVKKILNYSFNSVDTDALTSHLLKQYGEEEKALSNSFYLSKEEIKIMHNSGMVIGSHGMNHYPMVNLTAEKSKQEIEGSFNFFRTILGDQDIKTFCYPFGTLQTFGEREMKILKKEDVDFSFAVESRDVTTNDLINNIQSLPRYDCNEFKFGLAYRHQA